MKYQSGVVLALMLLFGTSVAQAQEGAPQRERTLGPHRVAGFKVDLSSLLAEDATRSLEWESTHNAASPDGRQEPAAPEAPDMAMMQQLMNNPLGNLWMLFFQNDVQAYTNQVIPGTETLYTNVFTFQPVLSIPLGDNWNLINRPVFPVVNLQVPIGLGTGGGGFPPPDFPFDEIPDVLPEFDRVGGFADMAFFSMVGPATGQGFLWGAGGTFIFPTANHEEFASHKWSGGPALLAGVLHDNITLIFLYQQWLSFAGDELASDVNKLNLQYFFWYGLSDTLQVGFSPIIAANFEAPEGAQWTVPVGIGVNKTVLLGGKLPVRLGAEIQYSVVRPEFYGNQWTLRLNFIPVLPSPFFDMGGQ